MNARRSEATIVGQSLAISVLTALSLSYSGCLVSERNDEGLWAVLAPSKEGWETRVPTPAPSRRWWSGFHVSGRIHRPSAPTRPSRMPQERRARPRATSTIPPFAAPGRCAADHASTFVGVFGAVFVRRIEAPVARGGGRRAAAGRRWRRPGWDPRCRHASPSPGVGWRSESSRAWRGPRQPR